MGMDGVEFVVAVEKRFGLELPDEEVSRMRTPRDVITHLRRRLPAAERVPCVTQQAFHRVRRTVREMGGAHRARLRPSTRLDRALPTIGERETRGAWRKQLGREASRGLPWPDWISVGRTTPYPTLGEVARNLAEAAPASVKRGGPWTDAEIEQGVRFILRTEHLLEEHQYTLDSEFVRDLGW